ncbi:HAD family hydrolase [Intrasporangium calvum]|uniref:HAD family hydrolase n=1 Tax=Intrasporangium calvum TaxID=53358 RepID=UPI000DF6447C|nr:HAD family hydrolase [Intrasporangium calvum]AXG13824.1 HAD family hydrolase [Intrasporangium calvum]
MTERALERALSGIRALVLDVDDTMLDTRAAMTEAGTHAARALWPDRAGAHRHMAQRYYADPGRWFHRYAAGEITIDRMRLERLGDVARSFEVELPEDALERYLAAYMPAFRRAQRLFDDVPGLLAASDAAGIEVALLTNSTTADTSLKLEALGLAARFAERVVTTDTLGFGKPDPRVYHEVCRLAGADPAMSVCVGDSLEWDVLGAIRAGLRGIWLDRPDTAPAVDSASPGASPRGPASTPAVARVRSLAEITGVLAVPAVTAVTAVTAVPGDPGSRFGAAAGDR